MKEFEPSKEFVSRVMKSVHAHENSGEFKRKIFERLSASRPFRYALSGSGAILGIFIPASCI